MCRDNVINIATFGVDAQENAGKFGKVATKILKGIVNL